MQERLTRHRKGGAVTLSADKNKMNECKSAAHGVFIYHAHTYSKITSDVFQCSHLTTLLILLPLKWVIRPTTPAWIQSTSSQPNGASVIPV